MSFSGINWLAAALCFGVLPLGAEPPNDVLGNYLAASEQRAGWLNGASMEVEITASLPKLKKTGKLQALRRISDLGRITYEVLGFEGDGAVKTNVIARYLAAEAQAGGPGGLAESGRLALTPANYKFKYKGLIEAGGRPAHVFQVSPRKKRVGLFKGELWIDAEHYLPLRESGRLVKNPSIFLRKMEFVKEYDISAGLAVPRRIQSVVDTRLAGRAELNVNFQNVMPARSSGIVDAGGR